MEGHASAFPLGDDMLASAPQLDSLRSVGESLGAIGAKVRSRRSSQPRRIICRWNVFIGKKRGGKVGKTKRGKGTKIMVLTDGYGLPIGVDTASASPHEVNLIEPLLEKRLVRRKPKRLIYDMAADSDPLRKRLRRRGIELI